MIRLWPRSMLGRNLMLLIPLVVASQLSVAAIWLAFVMHPRTDEAASLVASQIALADRLLSALPESERRAQLIAMHGVPTSALPPFTTGPRPDVGSYVLQRFYEDLVAALPPGVEIRWQGEVVHQLWVRLRASDQLWIELPMESTDTDFNVSGLLVMLLALTAFPTLGAYLIQRRIEIPLGNLAKAAAEVEHGTWPAAVPLKGPLELVKVTEAFNRMMAALSESETTRTEMLAGISHDIRTPLTKLRMVTSNPSTFDRPSASAERYIEDIDAIVGQFIDFARGSEIEVPELGDLNRLIEDLALDYAGLGHEFELNLQPLPLIPYRPISLQRVLMNLMQNAATYGRVGLCVGTRVEGNEVVLTVEDRGPGVPDSQLLLMKQPFRRGSRASGMGTGLGLAIADRIVRQHGGTLELSLRGAGGLIITVRLPLR